MVAAERVSATVVNSHTVHDEQALQRLVREKKVGYTPAKGISELEDLVLRSFRLLVADLCQQFNGGHPG
jgi:dihydroxyacetone synthase